MNNVVRMILHLGLIGSIAIGTVSCSSSNVREETATAPAKGKWVDSTVAGDSAIYNNDIPPPNVLPENVSAGEVVKESDEQTSITKAADDESYVSIGSGEFVNYNAASSTKRKRSGNITLNYQNADIREVIKGIIGDILNENYFIDSTIRGEVTLRTSQPIAKSSLIPTLEAILRMNKASLVNNNGLYQIIPENSDILGSAPSGLTLSSDQGYQILIVPLKYIAANEIQKILEPIKSRASKVEVDEQRNLLILAGTQAELANMKQTIATFDVDQLKGMSVGIFHLKTVDTKTIINDLDNIFGDPIDGALAGMVRFVPIDRLNSLLVITPQSAYLKEVGSWIDRLDVASQGSGAGLHVYKVQNGKATILAELLSSLYSDNKKKATVGGEANSTASAGGQPGSDAKKLAKSDIKIGDVSIVADEENNLLIIRATPSDYAKIEQALNRLDILPRQVLVEVSIVEVSLEDSLEYGIQWYLKNGRVKGEFSSAIPSSGFSYSLLDKAGAIQALLGTLTSESKANVISSPSLMVLDNRTATIRVGDQVPVRTSETTNTSSSASALVTSTIQYRDTGIILKVKPRVNAGGMVIMEVSQEVSDVAQSSAGGVPSPTIETRSIDTNIAVQSGETIVLGGLIKERHDNAASGIPGLRSLPLIGHLFQGSSKSTTRTELVVMITPSTVSNREDAREVTQEYQAGMKRLMTLF